ncbi:hypothetical protein P9112_014656 [Eukaryota sp. TZLM1-RC]
MYPGHSAPPPPHTHHPSHVLPNYHQQSSIPNQPPPAYYTPHHNYTSVQPPPAYPTGPEVILKQKFDAIDTDRSGALGVSELMQAFNTNGRTISPRVARLLIRGFAAAGEVTFAEYVHLDAFVTRMRNAFVAADAGKTGSISRSEMRLALNELGFDFVSNTTAGNLVRVFDLDNSDHVTYERFCEMAALLNVLYMLFRKYDRNADGKISLSFDQLVGFALFVQ